MLHRQIDSSDVGKLFRTRTGETASIVHRCVASQDFDIPVCWVAKSKFGDTHHLPDGTSSTGHTNDDLVARLEDE